MSDEKQESMADIVAEMRDHVVSARAWKAGIKPGVVMDFADRIEAAARRAYNEIDRAVRETGRVNAEGVELIRTAMNNTIGEYCE